ncbi:MAG: hypothetical protein GY847_38865 [Proteobacteria bacterium]|nr:hypothetical protein [Pseudomonadota bacterium]
MNSRQISKKDNLDEVKTIAAISCVILEEMLRVLMGYGVRKTLDSVGNHMFRAPQLAPVPIRAGLFEVPPRRR